MSKKTRHVSTVSIVGLSGPDTIKGPIGVGKSVLCNRLVRPNFSDFHADHISCLSQADFLCSNIVNAQNWLYWGEAEVDQSDYCGKTTHVRVIEQTVFLDDESFEALGGSGNAKATVDTYIKRALKTHLESPGKCCYISKDQLGQEQEFIVQQLPNGRTSIDGFCVVFDVSRIPGRSFGRQATVAIDLLLGALKTEKPILFVATKFDKADMEGIQEFQRLFQRKELKSGLLNHQMFTAEISALENVNVSKLLCLMAAIMDRRKKLPKLGSYLEAAHCRRIRVTALRKDFQRLLEREIPREEYLLQKTLTNWSLFLADSGLDSHPIYQRFIAEFGLKAARLAFDDHKRICREWWFERDIALRLPALGDVLRRLFDRAFLCRVKWEHLVQAVQNHSEFEAYFIPLGQSVERLSAFDEWMDKRLPCEMLNRMESQTMFVELQKELINEIALERQAEKFRQLLASKDVVTPGRPFKDARILVEEIAAFEKVLPPEHARRIYDAHQEKLKENTCVEFNELLLENVDLFVDIVVDWRTRFLDHPMIGVSERECSIIATLLNTDKRFRQMNGLPVDRQHSIGKLASFVSLPLERHCTMAHQCADLQIAILLENFVNKSDHVCPIELAIGGNESLAQRFLADLEEFIGPDRLFTYNSHLARFTLHNATLPSTASANVDSAERVPSNLFLISSPEDIDGILMSQDSTTPSYGLPPIFVQVNFNSNEDAGFHKACRSLAVDFRGTLMVLRNDTRRRHSNEEEEGAGGGQQYEDAVSMDDSLFSQEQLFRALCEVCAIQLESGYADLCLRISVMCGDPFTLDYITPLLEKAVRIDTSGRRFFLDTRLPGAHRAIRLLVTLTSYHGWMFGKWPLNSVHGHILVYSTTRRASWRHAKCAARLLIDSVGQQSAAGGDSERESMAKSILLVSIVKEPSEFFTNNDVNRSLRKGARLSEKIGCNFLSVSTHKNSTSSGVQSYKRFFERVFANPLPPTDYYVPTSTRNFQPVGDISSVDATSFFSGLCYTSSSTLTGSANTLLSGSENNEKERGEGTCVADDQTTIAEAKIRCEHCVKFRRKSHQSKRALLGTPPPPGSPVHRRRSHRRSSNDTGATRRESSEASIRLNEKQEIINIMNDFTSAAAAADIPLKIEGLEGSPPLQICHSDTCHLHQNAPQTRRPHSMVLSVNEFQQFFINDIPFVEEEIDDDDDQESATLHSQQRVSIGSSTTLHQTLHTLLDPSINNKQLPPVVPPLTPNSLRSRKIDKLIAGLKYLKPSTSSTENSPFSSPMLLRHRRQQLRRDAPIERTTTSTPAAEPKCCLTRESSATAGVWRNLSFFQEKSKNLSMEKLSYQKGSSLKTGRLSWLSNRLSISKQQQHSTTAKIGDSHSPSAGRKSLDNSSSSGASASTASVGSTRSLREDRRSLQKLCQNPEGLPIFMVKCIRSIEKNGGIQTEGLYRVPGNQAQVLDEKALRKPEKIDFDRLHLPVHAVATALKKFLDLLPDALIPASGHEPILQAAAEEMEDSVGNPNGFKQTVHEHVPSLNRRVLHYLLTHLRRVAENVETNAMDAKNLAKVWSPTVFRPNFDSFETMASLLVKFELAMFLLLQNCDLIFAND